MFGCDDTLDQLYAYLDEVLDEQARSEIELHVGDCPDCKDRVDFEYSLLVHIRKRSKEEPLPEELRRRLLECFDIDVPDGTRRDGE